MPEEAAENKDPSAAESLRANLEAQKTEGEKPVTTSEEAAGQKFEGKTREEVIRMYSELQRISGEQGDRLGKAEDLFRQISPYFKLEGDVLDLNEDVVKRWAETRGLIPPSKKKESVKEDASLSGEDFMETLEKKGSDAIRDVIREEIQKAFQGSLEPLQQQFMASQHQSWIKEVASKHPDFESWRAKIGKFIDDKRFPVNNASDLEEAYVLTKAKHGAYIDKGEHDSHVAELNKTLSMLSPGATRPPLDSRTASNLELLGLDKRDSDKDKVAQALFGKAFLKD